MFNRFMKGPWRFAAYAVVIAVAVGGMLFVLDTEAPRQQPGGGGGAAARPPWVYSPEAALAANENFSVERAAAGNRPLAGTGEGADWPQFNGLHRDNRSDETELLDEWPEGGPPLLWAAHGLGSGYSTVAVVKGVVYTLGNKGTSEALIALDAGTGQKIWSTPFARASHTSNGDGPRGTPAIAGDAVYGLGAEGELVCVDLRTGDLRWHRNLLTDYAAANLGWGICESVLIDGDRILCTPGGTKATIVALDKQTGKEVWKTFVRNDHACYTSPIAIDVGGVRQYVHFLSGGTVGVRADDGTFLWRNDRSANGTANCSSPLAHGDYVFSASNYGTGGALLKLTSADHSTSAELIHHSPEMKSHHGDMVIVDGLLFGSSDPGVLTCLDLVSGEVKWQNRSIGKGAVTAADGKISLRGEDKEVALIAATGDEYRELGRFEQPERSGQSAWSHPVVAHGRLFLRDQDVLLCYDVRKPLGR